MKHLKHFSLVFWLILVTGLVLTLAGCNTPIATPVSTATPVQDTPTAQTPATIRGTITYQAPPTPASMLYLISPERWYSLEVPSTSPSSTFEMLVAPGSYQLVAFPVGSEAEEFRPAAAYTTGSGIGVLTVAAGQVVEGIHVQNINSDRCVNYAFPASPDGRFPGLEENCSKLPTEIPPATIRGSITYQAPPTPASMLYFISAENMYPLEVPAGNPAASFELQVAPGTYQLIAFPIGSENLTNRPAAAYTTGSGISTLTVSAGQVMEGIHVQNINSDRCVNYAFPASPDGRFPAIEENCSKLTSETAPATVRGTISYQAPPAPTSMLYFISGEHWYVLKVPSGSPVSSFELQVAPGTYQVVAFPVGSENLTNRPAAAYSTGTGLGASDSYAGQVLDGVHVQNINSDRCVNYAFPASPDGRFPPIEENCSKLPSETTPATVRGTISYQAPPAPASMLYFISGEHWYVQEVPGRNPVATFELQVAPGTYQVVAFPVGSEILTNRPAAAYTIGSGIGFLTVAAGQVVEGIQVKNINSDRCINYAFPASPDGRFPPIEENCSKLTSETTLATITGTITYQAPPTPTSILYIISPERWYSTEVTGGSPASTFRLQVAPGTYQLIAFPVGSENLTNRPAAAYTAGFGINSLTVSAGQVVEGISVQNINSDRCVNFAFPASPDGRFPAIEANCK